MSDIRDPETDQVAPIPNSQPYIQDLVIDELAERKAHGIRKYGTALQAGNGRNPLQDLYEELLDATVYVRQALQERSEGLEFAWDIVDRQPEVSARCLLEQAPETVRLLQISMIRSLALRLDTTVDSEIQRPYSAGISHWLNSIADQLESDTLNLTDEGVVRV